ncbi:MAG: hypothetical protein AAF548_09995 [Actinomycetota bacterium]
MKKFLLIAAVVGVVAVLAKKRADASGDWQNLSEDEARQRIDDRFPERGDAVDLTETIDLNGAETPTSADEAAPTA